MRKAIAISGAVTVTVLVLGGLAWMLLRAAAVGVIVLLAVILASAIAPVAKGIHERLGNRAPAKVSLAIAYLAIFVAVVAGLGYYGFLVSDDVRRIVARIPEMLSSLTAMASEMHARYPWVPNLDDLLPKPTGAETATLYFGRLYNATLGAFGLVWGAITVLILSYYISIEAPSLRNTLLAFLPADQQEPLARDLGRIADKLGRYVRGQLLVSGTMGLLATIGSAAIGLHFPFLIGACVALSDFIPLVGGVVGSLPAIAIALTHQRWQLVAIVTFFFVLQQFENNILIPRVMNAVVGISPVITLVAALIGATAFGVPGALLAIPIASGLQVAAPVIVAMIRGEYGRPPP